MKLWRTILAHYHCRPSLIDHVRLLLEDEFADRLVERGLTATTPKHLWYDTDRQRLVIVEGHAPTDDSRPKYLRGLTLDICTQRISGTAVREASRGRHRERVSRVP
jgi:hypothetical protein